MKLFQEVRPGDLITAEQFNQVMLEIEKLAERLDRLEDEGPTDPRLVEITAVAGLRREDELLEVRGKNFEVPVELNAVTIDGLGPIRDFGAGSDDTRLFFIIPRGIQGLPKQVTLRVVTRTSSATLPFVLEPKQEIAKGTLTMVLAKLLPGHGVIGAGTPYALTFDVTGITTLADSYDVAGTLSTAGWGLDVGGTGTAKATLQIPQAAPPGATRSVTVRVTVPAGAPSGASAILNVSVTSRTNPELRQDKALVFTVGGPPPEAGTDVVVAFAGTVSAPGSVAEGGVVQVPGTRENVVVNYTVKVKEAGDYRFFGTFQTGTGWTVTPTSSSAPISMAAGTDTPLKLRINATNAASTPDVVIARVEKTDGSKAGEDRRGVKRT